MPHTVTPRWHHSHSPRAFALPVATPYSCLYIALKDGSDEANSKMVPQVVPGAIAKGMAGGAGALAKGVRGVAGGAGAVAKTVAGGALVAPPNPMRANGGDLGRVVIELAGLTPGYIRGVHGSATWL